jgi:hypothetical protein
MHRAGALLPKCRGALTAKRPGPQNLSEWRKRGFQQWLTLHTILDGSDTASENASEVAKTGIDCEKLLLLLTARYAECTARKRYEMGRGAVNAQR